MKKLSLKNLNLNADDMLQREQLKTVLGGYTAAQCVHIPSCWNWTNTTFNTDSQFSYYHYASTSASESNAAWSGLYDWCLEGNVGITIMAGCVS